MYFEFEYFSCAIVTAGIVPNRITPSKSCRYNENVRNFNKHGAENWIEWATNRQRADVKISNWCFTVICVYMMTWGRCLLMTKTFNSKTGKKKWGHAPVVNHMFSDFLDLYRVFSHDVTAAILVSQNNETAAILVSQNNEMAAMFVSQTNPVGVELFSYVNAFFCSNKFA